MNPPRPLSLMEKEAALLDELSRFRSGQDRLAHIVARARQAAPLEESRRRDEFLVEGCLSRLWFLPATREGRCYFESDSDSMIVKGIAGLLCEFYSGHAPSEIVAVEPEFLVRSGITQHLTPNRRNGLGRLAQLIRTFAREQMTSGASTM